MALPAGVGVALSVLAAVEPTEPQARRWLEEELAKPGYRDAGPSLAERFWRWLSDLLNHADGLPAHLGAILLVAAVLVVLVVLLFWAGPMRLTRRNVVEPSGVFADELASAAEHRGEASRLAQAGDWAGAVREAFRALVREQVDRGVVGAAPGLTATEAAAGCALAYPGESLEIRQAANLFDQICFGGRLAEEADYTLVDRLDARLLRARPGRVGDTNLLTAPR